jgi:diguanylate cyclase (GGDEF)-like protein/PAS domain S-box-containing protein
MGALIPATSLRRRSERVSIAFPVEVTGTDRTGKRFFEKTRTMTVSRYGCCVPLPYLLQPDQTVHLHRVGTNETAVGRIINAVGPQGSGRLYGVATQDPCESLWGIHFSTSIYEKLIDNVQDGVFFVNRERKITYWNEGAQQLSGYTASEAIGKSCFDEFLGNVDGGGTSIAALTAALTDAPGNGNSSKAEVYLRHKEGYRVPVSVQVMPMRDTEGDVVGWVQILSDVTANRRVEKRVHELEHLAYRDPLTALPNRRYLEMKVEQGLEEHRRFDRPYGLVMFDLDRFKLVNDNYGHEVGDALLKAIALSLAHGLRPVDVFGRWGGEEFLVLMPDLDAIALGDLAERCRVLIAQSSVDSMVDGGSTRVAVTASIGATVLSHSDSAMSTIRRVDELMYQSKHSGGDRTTAG